MDSGQDKKLFELLNSYTVADANEALLDRIVASVQEKKIVALDAYVCHVWIKSAAAMVVMAVMGFWLGNTSLPASLSYVQNNEIRKVNLEKVILGPESINEVML